MRIFIIAAIGILTASSGAFAQDFDLKKGKRVYNKCKACHAVGPDAKNKVGPHLNGIIGNGWGLVEGFKYSAGKDGSLKQLAEAEEKTWDIETLSAYLTKPKDVIPKGKMAFAGLKKEADITNVIAYIAQFDKDGNMVDPAEVLEAIKKDQ